MNFTNAIFQEVPKDDWYCPNCRCAICDGSQFNGDQNVFNELTVLFCDQCERECKCLKKIANIVVLVVILVISSQVSSICGPIVDLIRCAQ